MDLPLLNKTLYLLLVILIVLPISSASLGVFQQGDCVSIKTILNTSSVNISTINYPNSTVAISNQAMTKIAYTFNYTFCDTNELGAYVYDYFDAEGNVYVNDFIITTTGEQVSLSNIIIVLTFLLLAGLMFVLGYSFEKEKYIIKSSFYLFSLLMGLLSINSARIIASESLNLSKMANMGLILMIGVLSFMFLFVLVYFTIQTVSSMKRKEGLRWDY